MKTNLELSKLNSDTKVKYIHGDFSGATSLENKWGSLGSMLKKTLTEGFYESSIEGIELDNSTRILTIELPVNHNYSLGCVIKINNVGVHIDGEYRILDFSSSNIRVKAKEALLEGVISVTEDSSIAIAPLGYEILFDELNTTGKLVFKNKSLTSPAVLKLIDYLPPNGYLTTWAKFARVVVGQNIVDIDTFLNNEKVPYRADFPNAEKTGNEVMGAPGIHGFAKWYYAVYPSNTFSEYSDPTQTNFPTKWRIIGDDKTFYLFIKTMGHSYSGYTIYSFGNYTSNLESDTQNILLHASFCWVTANQDVGYYINNQSYYYGAAANVFTRSNWYGALALFKNTFRGNSPEFLGYHFGLDPGTSDREYPSNSSSISSVSGNTGKKLTSPIFIKDKNLEYRGYLRGISQFYGKGFSNLEGMFLEDSNIVLSARKAYESDVNNDQVPYLFSLKDWN